MFGRRIGKIPGRRIGLPKTLLTKKLLMNDLGWGLLRNERQLQVVDDTIDDGRLGEERDDPHRASALGAVLRSPT